MEQDNKQLSAAHKKMHRAVKALNEAMEVFRQEWPEANYYVENDGNFYLLKGQSHDKDTYNQQQRMDNIIDTAYLDYASGGGW